MQMQVDPSSMIGQLLDDGRLRVSQVIGSGSFATVYLAESTSLPIRHYAVKSLFKRGLNANQLALQQHELNFLRMVSPHPNIVNLHSALQDDNFLHLVMEFAPNDLFDFIADTETMNDEVIKSTFQQIVQAVKHCHNLNVFHRDLKPENILIVPISTTVYSPKLTDFGLATQETRSTDFGVGSIRYLAPECLPTSSAKWYSPAKADIWALGIILVNMISGKNPWRRADNSDESFKCYRSDSSFWRAFGVAPEAQSLVSDILCMDPNRRIGLNEIEKRLQGISVFRNANGMDEMGERESTIGTVFMEREHRSWNSWNSEMSFAHPLVFGDAEVPEEMQIRSPSLSYEDYEDDNDEDTVGNDDMIIFPPMCDDEEEVFAQVLVRGQVPSFVKSKEQENQLPKKKRGKSKKPKAKVEVDAIDKEPHENSDTLFTTAAHSEYFKHSDSGSTPIAIPRNRVLIEGDKTPTGRVEVSTMTEDDEDSPGRWHKTLVPSSFDKKSSSYGRGRSSSRTPPGKAMNPRNSPTNPFTARYSDRPETPGRNAFDGSYGRPGNLQLPSTRPPVHGESPYASPIPLNPVSTTRNGFLAPVTPRYARTPSPSGGSFVGRRNSPPSIYSLDRTPRKQEYHSISGGRASPGREEYLGMPGTRSPATPTSRASTYMRRSESGTRPTFANRPTTYTASQTSRTSFSAHRSNQIKPLNTTSGKHFVDYQVPPGSTNRGFIDDQKWTKQPLSAFAKNSLGATSTRKRNDEWKKQEEWQPFGGLMEFGWEKYGKREQGRREWKKREIL